MNRVVTKIFLSEEPNIETSSHVYSTRDPIEGFITLRTALDTQWSTVVVRFAGVQKASLPREDSRPGLYACRKSTIELFKIEICQTALEAIGTTTLEAQRLYRIPFRFVVPEMVAMGFARSWSQREALKEWHALLPPSFDSRLQSRGIVALWKQDEPGGIQYTVSASLYQALSRKNATCIGSSEREVRLRPRPWQVELLDNTPFVDTERYRYKSLFRGLFRSPLDILSLESPSCFRGRHFTGQLSSEGTMIFVGILPIVAYSKHQEHTGQAPRLLSVAGEVHEFTTYRSEAMSVANPLDGHRVCHKSELSVVQTHASHWQNGFALAAGTSDEHQAVSTVNHMAIDTSVQKISIDWSWRADASFAPSFSTALISHWFEIHLEIRYARPDSNAPQTLRCVCPTKLSLEPSPLSVFDNPPQNVPSYESLVTTSDQGWLDSIVLEDLPSYESCDGNLGRSNRA